MGVLIDRPVVEARAAPRFTKGDYGDAIEGQSASTYMPGDHVVLTDIQGAPSLYHINDMMPDGQAVCERVDADLNPTGDLRTHALSPETGLSLQPEHFAALQPLYVINEGGADDYSVKASANAASRPDSDFAYVPKGGSKSDRKLPIYDASHIKLAWQAVTKGMMGQKAKIGGAIDSVKRKIKAAANALPAGPTKDAVLAYIKGKSGDGKKSAELILPDAPPARERNIAAKAISADGWRIGGYLVLWGDAQHTDLTGDWFTKSTDFKLDWYDRRPFLYEHGQDGVIKATDVGTIDTLEADDYGVWMEAQLDRANRYAKRVKELVSKGKLGLSSGSMPHLVGRLNNAAAGQITQWPIGEGSGTVTPAEPRTMAVPIKHFTDAQTLDYAYKSIGKLADRWLDGAPQEAPAQPDQDSQDGSDAASAGQEAQKPAADGNPTKSDPNPLTEEPMTQEEMAVIARMVAEQMKQPAPVTVDATATPVPANGNGTAAKALPASGPAPAAIAAPPAQPETRPAPQNVVRVIGDRRFADFNAEDMAFMVDMYGGVMDRLALKQSMNFRGYEPKPLETAAKRFFDDWKTDPDRKMQRLVSDKVLRGIAENRLDPNLVDFIPFPTKAAVEGNYFDPDAVQYAREDRLAAKMFDQGKDAKEINAAIKSLSAAYKSNELDNTAQSSFGAEWVPTIWNSDAWRRIRINNIIASQILNVQMPSNPWNWPIESTDPTIFYIAEGTDATQLVLGSGNTLALSKAGTGKISFTAKKLGGHIGFSVEENEDSIIPIIPIWRFQLTRALWNFVDDTIINGDTTTSASTNINLIDATPAAGTSYLALDGMRKYCLITNTGQLVDFGNVAPTMTNLRAMQGKLKVEYQADFVNLAYVTNVQTWQKMKAMPEFAAYLNSGVAPTQITGLLPGGSPAQASQGQVNPGPMPVGFIDGIPLYVSAQINLSKSGAIGANGGEISNTGGNNIDGSVLLFHRSRCVLGWRRAITTDMLATAVFSDTYQMWGTCRIAFNTFDTQSISLGYDIAN